MRTRTFGSMLFSCLGHFPPSGEVTAAEERIDLSKVGIQRVLIWQGPRVEESVDRRGVALGFPTEWPCRVREQERAGQRFRNLGRSNGRLDVRDDARPHGLPLLVSSRGAHSRMRSARILIRRWWPRSSLSSPRGPVRLPQPSAGSAPECQFLARTARSPKNRRQQPLANRVIAPKEQLPGSAANSRSRP